MEGVFSSRIPEIARRIPIEIPGASAHTVFWVTPENYYPAMATRQKNNPFQVLGTIPLESVDRFFNRGVANGSQHLIFDIRSEDAQRLRPTLFSDFLEKIETYLKSQTEVEEDRTLFSHHDQKPIARILKFRWKSQRCEVNCAL